MQPCAFQAYIFVSASATAFHVNFFVLNNSRSFVRLFHFFLIFSDLVPKDEATLQEMLVCP